MPLDLVPDEDRCEFGLSNRQQHKTAFAPEVCMLNQIQPKWTENSSSQVLPENKHSAGQEFSVALDETFREREFFDLLQQAREGDQAALGQLLEQYRDYLLLIANEDCESWLAEKVGPSDLVQTSLLNGYQRFCQFRGTTEQELRGWLRQILKNDLKKNARHFQAVKRRANAEIKLEANSQLGRGMVDRHQTPQTRLLDDEKQSALVTAIGQLPTDQQQIIQLRNVDQLSFKEIGKRIGRGEDAARKFWARSIENLKALIKDLSPELLEGGQDPTITDED